MVDTGTDVDAEAGDRPGPTAGPVREAAAAAADLREAYDDLAAVEARIADLGRERVEAAADRYRNAVRVLDDYEEDAVGTGDFGAYVQFESAFEAATDVDEDALAADAFAAANEAVDKRRLSESDFEAAREHLEDARDYVRLLERRDEALDEYRRARRDANAALSELDDRVDELADLADAAEADLDAPVDRLREPIAGYNEAVETDFRRFKKDESARALFDLLERAGAAPLIDVDEPPTDLTEYVAEYPAAEEPVPDLLEYADYSQSKLDHYVEDPGALRRAVAVHRTYLERLDGEPFTLAWPPKPAEELRYRVEELIPVVSRFAEEETVATLRDVLTATRDDDYERIREAATVRAELDDEELALVASGAVHDRLAEARAVRDLVRDVLAETER